MIKMGHMFGRGKNFVRKEHKISVILMGIGFTNIQKTLIDHNIGVTLQNNIEKKKYDR